MNVEHNTTPKLYLRAYVDGRPVDYSIAMQAIRDGRLDDLARVEVAIATRRYRSKPGEPVPDELAGYPPVSSETLREGGPGCQ